MPLALDPALFDAATLDQLRGDFPALHQCVHGNKPLVYLDNGATTQKPAAMIDALTRFYQKEYGTVRRGVYALAEGATTRFDAVREQVARFVNAASSEEVVFTHGCTEGLNLLAFSLGEAFVGAGDVVISTAMEHHANLVPWQQLCLRKQATLRVVPFDERGELKLEVLEAFLQEGRVKVVTCTHVSNVLGTVNPIERVAALAHQYGALCVVDGAQAVPHQRIDLQALGCDAYVFSPHKAYGPTGLGVLVASASLLNQLPPYQCGGDMIDRVSMENSTFLDAHRRFEAGTPPIAEVICFGESLRYLESVGMERIAAHESALLALATEALQAAFPKVVIHGHAAHKAGVLSFSLPNVHPFDLGTLLDLDGIAIRTGHHCAQPLLQCLGVSHTLRASFALYNTPAEVEAFIASLKKNVPRCQG